MNFHCEHEYSWVLTPAFQRVTGYYDKRGIKSARCWFTGNVLKCAAQPCDEFLFVPEDKNLKPVICEMEAA